MIGARTFGPILIAALALPAGAADAKASKAFSKAVSEAKANLGTMAGHTYDVAFSASFESSNGPPLKACFDETPNPDPTRFEMVFSLSGEGKTRQILVWPETNIARCFKGKLENASFPVPPSDGYLAYVDMRFGQ